MERGKRIITVAIFLSMLWMGCVKDPQDIPGGLTMDPVFGMNAKLDGQPLDIEAGRGGWTMQPFVEDENVTMIYTSIFSLNECLDHCTPSLEFRFYRVEPAAGDAESDFLQTINLGSKEFILSHQQRDSFDIKLNAHPGLFMSGYSYWDNLNGTVNTYQAEYRDVVGYGESLNVCLQSLAYTGCQYNQCIYFNPSTLIPCITSIQPRLEDARTMILTVRPEYGTSPFTIEWFDGSTSSSIILPLQDSTVEIYAGVTVTDGSGNRSELNQTIRIQNGIVDACYFPISLVSTPVPNSFTGVNSGRVEINYTDENGVEWSSTSGVQPSESNMLINDVQYFEMSPLNQPAYKTELNMTVTLFNATGQSKVLQTQDASIALSHR